MATIDWKKILGGAAVSSALGAAVKPSTTPKPATVVKASPTVPTTPAPTQAPVVPVAIPKVVAPRASGAYKPGSSVNEAYQAYLKQLNARPEAYVGKDYTPSDLLMQYIEQVTNIQGQKPGEYNSAYADQIKQLYDQSMNRGPFKYDLNADALYQQMKDRYIQQANMGMQDTMGQAAALTGGYGNSYAQSAGQQSYDRTMQGLNDMVPHLEERAYNRYQSEGADLMNRLGIAQGMDASDYGRYRDTVGDWRQEYAMALQRMDAERNFDYGQYVDDRNFGYGQYRDNVGDWYTGLGMAQDTYQNERGFDYGNFRDTQAYDFQQEQWRYRLQQDAEAKALAQAQLAAQQAAAQAAAAAASSRRSSGSGLSAKEKLFAEWYAEEQKRKEEELKNKIVNPQLAPLRTTIV